MNYRQYQESNRMVFNVRPSPPDSSHRAAARSQHIPPKSAWL